MGKAVYGFDANNLEETLALLARALGVRLYPAHSPMIGRWYSSVNLAEALGLLRQGQALDQPAQTVSVESNDPEPGYMSPLYPGGGAYLLRLEAPDQALAELERRLGASGLPLRRLDQSGEG